VSRLGLALLGLVVGLSAAEAMLRVLSLARPGDGPRGLYELRPDRR